MFTASVQNFLTYHVALYYVESVAIHVYTTSGNRAWFAGNAAGTNVTFTETTGAVVLTEATVFAPASSMSVTSVPLDLSEAPDWARIEAFVNPIDGTVGTDLFFDVSRDGSDWQELPVTQQYTRQDGSIVFDSGTVALTSDSGTTGSWRIRTANSKIPKTLALGLIFGVD